MAYAGHGFPAVTFPASPLGNEKVIPELGEYIIAQRNSLEGATEDEFNRLLTSIKLAAKLVNREIRKSGLPEDAEKGPKVNIDEFAKEKFIYAMRKREVVCGIVAPGETSFITVNRNAHFVLILSPLEDSQHVHHNVPSGTIFSIYRRVSAVGSNPIPEDFLQPGRKLFCAGYVVYGPCTQLVLSAGSGVQCFTLDPSVGTFFLSHPLVFFPLEPKGDYSVDEGGFNKYSPGMQKAITYLRTEDKATGRPYACRYIGSLISDFHRNLFHGGVYLCPRYDKNTTCFIQKDATLPVSSPAGGSELGHSLIFQCNPIAFLAEQAGGAATDGFVPILHKTPLSLRQNCQLVVGQAEIVQSVGKIIRNTDGQKALDGSSVGN